MIIAGAFTSVSVAFFLEVRESKRYVVPGTLCALGALFSAYAEESGLTRALVGNISGSFKVGLFGGWGCVHLFNALKQRNGKGLVAGSSLWIVALWIWRRNRPGPTISDRQMKLNFSAMIDYMKDSLTTPFGDATHLPTFTPSQRLFPM